MLKENILALAQRYLEQEIDRSGFAEQFASLYHQVRNSRHAPLEVRSLCSSIMLPFAELSRGHRDEVSFRQELANAILPFVQWRVYAKPIEIEIGTPRYRASSEKPVVIRAVA